MIKTLGIFSKLGMAGGSENRVTQLANSFARFMPTYIFAEKSFSKRLKLTDPANRTDGPESGSGSPGDRNEYVELYNADSTTVDVEAWVLWDGDALDLIRAWSDTNLADPDVVILVMSFAMNSH